MRAVTVLLAITAVLVLRAMDGLEPSGVIAAPAPPDAAADARPACPCGPPHAPATGEALSHTD